MGFWETRLRPVYKGRKTLAAEGDWVLAPGGVRASVPQADM